MTLSSIINGPFQEDIIKRQNEPSGSVISSVEATLINTCNQLDMILADKSRWTNDQTKKVQEAAEIAIKEQIDFLKAQRRAAAEINTPHFQHRPSLMRTPDGTGWIAFIGDALNDPNNSICGIGKCPRTAIESFDAVFNGDLPIHMLEWIREREIAIKAGVPVPETPNKTNEQSKPLDGGGNKKANRPARRRKKSK